MDQKKKRIRGTTVEVEQAARKMRHAMTPAEALLWQRLMGKQLHGYRFRAQHPLGQIVVDFCCPSKRLIIEVDGPIHQDQVENDIERTRHLEAYGYRVIRFRNDEILTDIETVLSSIRKALHNS